MGYIDGKPQWSENEPAVHVPAHGWRVGGHAIEEKPSQARRAAEAQAKWKASRKETT